MSSLEPIVVIAHFATKPESVASVLALLTELRQRSLGEPGCPGYEIFRSVEAPERLVLIESYDDASALEAHRSSTHYRELLTGRVLPLLGERRVELLRAESTR